MHKCFRPLFGGSSFLPTGKNILTTVPVTFFPSSGVLLFYRNEGYICLYPGGYFRPLFGGSSFLPKKMRNYKDYQNAFVPSSGVLLFYPCLTHLAILQGLNHGLRRKTANHDLLLLFYCTMYHKSWFYQYRRKIMLLWMKFAPSPYHTNGLWIWYICIHAVPALVSDLLHVYAVHTAVPKYF